MGRFEAIVDSATEFPGHGLVVVATVVVEGRLPMGGLVHIVVEGRPPVIARVEGTEYGPRPPKVGVLLKGIGIQDVPPGALMIVP